MRKRLRKPKPLTVPCKLECLDALAVFVQQASKEADLDYRTSYRLRLAVDEIATNIILHGLTDSPQPSTLTVYAELDDRYLTICLEDTGTGYNPAEAIPPDKIRGPEEGQKVGGWGIYLAMWGVDEFEYVRLHERNLSKFRVQRPLRGNRRESSI